MVEAGDQLAGVQAIDESTFLSLVQPLVPVSHRLAHAMLRNPNDAEDMVQEATL